MKLPFAPVKVHSEPYAVHFVATSRCSCAYCLWLIVAVTGLVVPLILALQGHALWARSAIYHERPVVTFTNNFYLLTNGQPRAGAGVGFSVDSPSGVSIQSNSIGEGQVQLEVAVQDGTEINSLEFIGEFKMELSKKHSILSYAAVGAEFIRPSGIMSSSRLNAWLSLDLVQKEALEEGSQVESLFGQAAERLSSGGGGSSEDFFVTLGALQADSGVTLVGRKVFPDVWSSPSSGLNTTDFTALLTFIVPEQIVYYSMEGFETWKFAWVQYLAILFPSYLIATCVLSFCYRNSLVRTFVVDPLASRRLVVGERIKAA